ncbi:hypothetical protein KC367_g7065 [Hortaea werneckii]|nr:hypothetical protein KC358_g12238 [Hortaea werneckii]KAI6817214.1 hypothetical protein KC350_g10626 [Hortaea werneckii]KAI6916789.1 hypothetical protein KC348_g11394 [Hortaea werneckii]KAI6927634.1 hypothetical protein KC341_g12001 [Hortaea werneckii]KAI6961673.1 hypothetical protein KC321_g12186 [Hortaea werneckii]
MRLLSFFSAVVGLLGCTSAASLFAGSNLYYAAGLNQEQQTTLFKGLQDANVQVLRVWLDGQDSPQKGSYFTSFPSREAKNALKAHSDFYGQYYGTGLFYSDKNAIEYYKDRIAHVMAHVNPYNGNPWSESPEYIFAFETQNEAMHGNEYPDVLADWQCEIAGAIKDNLQGRSDILVSTGGGSYLATSAQDPYFSCAALDVIAIHAYGLGDLTKQALEPYVKKAQASGKKLIMQEWGMCYYDTSNNNCPTGDALSPLTRDNNIKKYADSIGLAGIPWMYWQIIPNGDAHYGYDYEVGIDHQNWGALKAASQVAQQYAAAFDFSEWL